MFLPRNKSETTVYLNKVSDLIVEYGIHGVSVFGSLFNIVTIIVLATNFFDHKFYNFLRCRCICNLAVCLIGIFLDELPKTNETVEYFSLFYQLFAITLPLRVFFIASAISDNLIILNRLATLYEKNSSIFFTLSKRASTIRQSIFC